MADTKIKKDLKQLATFAKSKGAVEAKGIPIEHVVMDERVYYKCLYGCPRYNSSKMCPPNTPLPADFERALRKYQWGILVKTRPHEINEIVVAVEREAFLLGHYLALGLRGGPCPLCPECTDRKENCRNPEKARPSMEAVGIDVFATLKNAGISADLKKNSDDEIRKEPSPVQEREDGMLQNSATRRDTVREMSNLQLEPRDNPRRPLNMFESRLVSPPP
jgi:predicted metal-binding protein